MIMRSQQELEKVRGEIKINTDTICKLHHMEHIIGILLYNSFIELPGSNQAFEENQGLFILPRARQAGRKEHAT